MRSTAGSIWLSARQRRIVATVISIVLSVGLLIALPATQSLAASCPCTIWAATAAPSNPSENDSDPVELGVKFRSNTAGLITGIRFYKGTGNTGTHVGNLWTNSGTSLATVTFSSETATGWQQADFATPVAIDANTTYVASYYAPVGRYAADNSYFTSGVTNGPLTALANGTEGGNGVYRYGSGGGFPSSAYQSSNYWVDVVFNTGAPDTTSPTVTDRQPAPNATGVAVSTLPAATFSENIVPASITMTLSNPGGPVPASLSYDAPSRKATLTPSAALAVSTVYTVNVSNAADSASNVMAPVSWSFTTATTASGCPCTIWPNTTVPAIPSNNDNSAVELGVKFRASSNGYITGLRFYKGTANTGTHVGSLWNTGATKLASVTFTGESASGWQQAMLSAPVPVTANVTYIASYHAPVGRYAVANNFFASAATANGPLTALRNGTDGGNGVYKYGASGFPISTFQSSNYYVDVVFDPSAVDTTPPTVVGRAPAPGATGVAVSAPATATFSESVQNGTITMGLVGPSGAVPATLAYDNATLVATLTPSGPLAYSTTYTVNVSGAKDTANNSMAPVSWSFSTAAPPPPGPGEGPGGPIAVVTSAANPYSSYLAEIMRTEGLNEFATIDVSTLSVSALAGYDVVVLGAVAVSTAQAADLATWVGAGGNLIALRPSANLAGLLGITAQSGQTSDAYLKVDATTAAGAGIVSETIQYHGPADRYSLSSAQAVATIYSTATTATTFPAVTLNNVGTSGGQSAAFTYDLARSIALTRQGNPAWTGLERDGQAPIRSDDLFFGGSQTDWVNLNKVAIPQADEQQRLLANLIQVMNRDRKPLPRFWYFPRSLKAVVVATGDDHANGGTAGRFDQYIANSPPNCSVVEWTCLRSSSYLFPNAPLSNAAAAGYTAQGFEVGLHQTSNCSNFTASSLAANYANDFANWYNRYPSLPAPSSSRFHCLVWSDWASQPKTELANEIRLDSNYYYWPGSWIQNRPGFMSGSGMPMRFTDTNGTMINVYQSVTQMTDESNQGYPFTPNTLLDNALGSLGYYGAFNANMHTDAATIFENDQLIASATARGVPLISGRQLLAWLDGRNGSSFSAIGWTANTLSFTVGVGAGANGLTGMLPTAGPGGTVLTGIALNGAAVSFTTSTIKGLEYASFSAAPGSYAAVYAVPGGGPAGFRGTSALTQLANAAIAPTISAVAVTTTPTRLGVTASASWTTTEPATTEIALGTSATILTTRQVVADVTTAHGVTVPALRPGTTYYYRVTSRDPSGEVSTWPDSRARPATFTTPATDRTRPTTTEPGVAVLPDGTALISWTTNEPTDSIVKLGESTAALAEQALAPALVQNHQVVLTDLEPNRTYYVNVTSADATGNAVTSKVVPVITPGPGTSEQATASFRRGTVKGDATISSSDLGSVTLRGQSGTFVSGILDAQAMVDWDRLALRADIPTGSTLQVLVRTGSMSTPDGSWTAWRPIAPGERVGSASRYIQYRVDLASGPTAKAPSLFSISFGSNAVPIEAPTETG